MAMTPIPDAAAKAAAATPAPAPATTPATTPAQAAPALNRQMMLLPTFDGQTRGIVAVNPAAIDLIKPAMTPGLSTVYLTGDLTTNAVTVDLELGVLIEKLREVGVSFVDLTGGRKIAGASKQDDGGH